MCFSLFTEVNSTKLHTAVHGRQKAWTVQCTQSAHRYINVWQTEYRMYITTIPTWPGGPEYIHKKWDEQQSERLKTQLLQPLLSQVNNGCRWMSLWWVIQIHLNVILSYVWHAALFFCLSSSEHIDATLCSERCLCSQNCDRWLVWIITKVKSICYIGLYWFIFGYYFYYYLLNRGNHANTLMQWQNSCSK